MSDLSQGTPVKPTPVARDQDISISIVLATAITRSTGLGLTAYDVGYGAFIIDAIKGDKQLYYCFNCKRGGNTISFYSDTKRITYGMAVRELAELNGIDLGGKQV